MRSLWLGVAVGVAFAISACGAPAPSEYVFEDLGVAAEFPTEPERTTAGYYEWDLSERNADVAGREVQAVVLSAAEDSILYRMSVVDFRDRIEQAATLWGECIYLNEESGAELANVNASVGEGAQRVYGRIQTIELRDNQGRLQVGCYFHRGRLYKLEAQILPEHGDDDAPEAMRFVRSVRFLG